MNRMNSLFGILAITAALAMQAHAQNWLTNSLVAHYPFNGNANDESGFGDNGVVYGAQLCADRFGNTNRAYSFQSQNLCAIKTAGRNLPIGSATRTPSLWFRAKPQYPSGTFSTSPFFECGNPSVAESWLRSSLVYQGAPNLVTFYLQTGTNAWSTWKSGWDFAQWHQVVWAVPATNSQTRLYVDGVVQAFNGAPAAGALLNTVSNVFWLGYGSGSYFDGALDDIRIYNRALSDAEVLGLYAAEAPANSGPPVIVAQPQDQTVRNGGEAVFAVAANGQQPLRTQWRFNGVSLAGATNAVLRLTNLQASASGLYNTVVSNTVGSVASAEARLTILSPIPGGPAPTNGLVAYYPFNGNANDESGNGAHGTNYGARLAADRLGVPNHAYYFNAASLSAIAANIPGLPTNGAPRTVSLWYRSDWLSSGVQRRGALFGYGGSPSAAGWFQLRALPNNWITVLVQGAQWISGSVPTTDGQWHQAVLVVQSNSPSLYLDGVAQPWQSFPPVGTVINSGGAPFQIGSYGGEYFDGNVDDVRIYNRDLSQMEVLQLYAAEAPANAGPPVIVNQPQDGTITLAQDAWFSVAANGQPPLRYQWQFNGLGLLGATNPVLRVANAQAASDGYYSVVISNAFGAATSAVARLVVLLPVAGGLAPNSGLVAYYPFNGNANDESGNAANGTPKNATLAADRFGTLNRAYHFSSTNLSGITANVPGLPTGTAPRTISLWYQSDWSSTSERTGYLFGYGGSTNIAGWFGLRALSYKWLTTTLWYGKWIATGMPTSDGRWHQAVLVLVTNSPTLYVDGLAQTWPVDPPLGTVVDSGGSPFQIGSYGTEYFDGSLDDIRIYNRALSQAEVYQLYNAEAPLPPTIVLPPQNVTANLGGPATLGVTAAGTPPFTYQWRKDGITLAGATNNNLTLASVQLTNIGNYSVVVGNAYGSATSSVASLSISNVNSSLWQGLVAYYPFNGNANDESGYGDPSAVNGAQPGIDRFGHANSAYGFQQYQLNYIQAAGTNIPRGLAARTFSVWFRQSPRVVGDQIHAPIFSLWDGQDSTKAFVVEFWTNSLQVQNAASSGAGYKAFDGANQTMTDGQWHQLVITVVTNSVAAYLDARPIVWADQATAGAQWSLPQGSLWIGEGGGEPSKYYDGQLDDLRVYNRGLSPTEVSQLYSSEAPANSGPPVIIDQPRDQVAAPGDEAYFSVAVRGQNPVSRQWRCNGLNIPGATNAILKMTNVQAVNDGLYNQVLSNASGSVTSVVAHLTVLAALPGAGAPTNGLVAHYPLSGNAKDASGFGDDGVVRGAQSSADRFGQANQAYTFDQYQMNYIQAGGTKVPRGFGVRTFSLWFRQTPRIVGDVLHAPMLSLWDDQDPNQAFAIEFWGNSLQVWNSGSSGAAYKAYSSCGTCPGQPMANGQWHQVVCVVSSNIVTAYLDALPVVWSGGLPLPSAQWSLPQGSLWIGGAPGQYYDGQLDEVRIYDRALSQAEVFQLYSVEAPTTSGPPLIVGQPQEQAVPLNSSTYLAVVANGQIPLLYQWRFNAASLPGATNAALQMPHIQVANDGLYTVVVSNPAGVITSSPARLTVLIPIPAGQPPTNGLVAYYPFNGNANDQLGLSAPGAVSFAVPATDRFGNTNGCYAFNPTNQSVIVFPETVFPRGTQPATIAFWIKQTPTSPGSRARLLQIADTAHGTNWFFELLYDWAVRPVLQYLQGNAFEGLFTCYALNPGFTQFLNWEHIVLTFNSNSVLSMYVNGKYQPFSNFPSPGTVWSRPGGALRLGDTFSGLIDDVRIYNRELSPIEVLQLAVAEGLVPPEILVQPQGVILEIGQAVAFSATAAGLPPLSYQWRKDGVGLPSATNAMLTFTNVQPPCIGDYTVVVSNPYGSATSSVAALSISNVNSALWQGLVAYYPFNGNANDESGFGDHGVVQGASLAPDRSGRADSAYNFVATNKNSITASGLNLPRSKTPRTVSLWIRPKRQNDYTKGTMLPPYNQEIPVGWGNISGTGRGFPVILNNANGIQIAAIGSGTGWNYDFLLLDDIWHHVVITYAGGSNVVGYVDGFSASFGNTSLATLWDTGDGALSIGSFFGWRFDGQIDDIRIYNRPLSGTEAHQLYVEEAGAAPRITNIVNASTSVGYPATLSATADGGQPISYQWYDRYNNLVAGATNASLPIPYAAATNLGQYRVVASNTWGLASAPATLTVNNPYSPVYLPLSRVVPGSEVVTLVPNGNLETLASTNSAGRLLPSSWTASGDSTLVSGANKTEANGNYVSAAFITNHYAAFGLSQIISLQANTEYVLSGYVWNMGDTTNSVNTALDTYDVAWDPQINLWSGVTRADEGYFVYRKFHSAASGTNVTVRAFYGALVGNGASAAYYPLAAQWDNIAVTKASEFVPPENSPLPWFIILPQSRTVAETSSVQLYVQADGPMPLSYQWFRSGQALFSATNQVLTIVGAGMLDAGDYTVVVTNAYGAITSSPALLAVRALLLPGTVAGPTTNAGNGHVYYLLGFSSWVEAEQGARALGGHLVTIRSPAEQDWLYGAFGQLANGPGLWIGLVDSDPLHDATNFMERRSEFVWVSGEPGGYSNWKDNEPNNNGTSGEFYGMIFGMNYGPSVFGYWNDSYAAIDSWTQNWGMAEVIPAPSIVTPPANQTVAAGSQAVLSAGVVGALPMFFQWRKDGFDIHDATNAILTIAQAQFSDSGTYKLFVSNAVGVATSQAAVLTVIAPVAIVGQPHMATVNLGGWTNFTVTATGGGAVFYQWCRNNSPIPGATSLSLTITNAQATDDADYSAVVSNVVSSVTSARAHLLVVFPPLITTQPVSRTNVAGTTAIFSVGASGTNPNYRWRKGGVNLAGGTNNTLTLVNVTSSNAGVYDAVVWNPAGTNTSLPATLTVLLPPSITASPTNQGILVSNSVTFSVTAIGMAPLRYQWRKAGVPISGATTDTYAVAIVQTNDAGSYDVVVTNAVGSATSGAAVLTVFYPPAIWVQPANTTADLDGTATFAVVAIGSPLPTYRWLLNGTAVARGANATLELTEVAPSDAGSYKVVVANPYGAVTSAGAILTVLTPLTLPEALDAVGYLWTTGGNTPWVAQTNVTSDGMDAAASGIITDYQQSWVETKFNGPGQLAFEWKVSSEFGFDRLVLTMDGMERSSVSGEVGWTPQTLAVTGGTHTLRWTYAKDGSAAVGQDRAWLDQVNYSPAPGVWQPVYVLQPKVRLRDGLFQFDLLGEPGKTITVELSTTLHDWSPLVTVTNQTGAARFVDVDTTANPSRFYRVRSP